MDKLTSLVLSAIAVELVICQDAAYWNYIGQDEIRKSLLVRPNMNVAKNVILFLGDGLGISTITATRILKGQLQNKSGEDTVLEFEKFPNVALLKTYNVDRQVADSAGTATALLSGVKTNYGVVGCSSEAKFRDCESSVNAHIDGIVHWSEKEGKSTGLVTTASVTHASPSSAYAHSASRYWEGDMKMTNVSSKCKDIAYQLIHENQMEVVFGGGRQWFYPNTIPDPETGKINMKYQRNDSKNLIEVFLSIIETWTPSYDCKNIEDRDWKLIMERRSLRYKYLWKNEDFWSLDPNKVDNVLGLFNPKHMDYELERDKSANGEPSLKEMTEKAIQILQKNHKGFFLFVEGARIDHAHHDSKAKKALHESLALEEAVRTALDLTSREDTLIIVTADHSHVFNIVGYPKRGNDILGVVQPIGPFERPLDNKSFTALVYANGPGYDQNRTDPKTQNLRHDSVVSVLFREADDWPINYSHKDDNDFVQYGGIPMMQETHGGEDVAAFAVGPMAHLIQGVKEQNYIAHVMAYASCVGVNKAHCSDYTNNANTFLDSSILVSISILSVILINSKLYECRIL